MSVVTPPFFPQFGHGAPGAGVPTNQLYYDVDTNPFTPYVYRAGSWHNSSGSGSAGADASSIQGITVDATPPTAAQVLEAYDAGGGTMHYKPTDLPAGIFPVTFQTKAWSTGSETYTITDSTVGILLLLMTAFTSGAKSVKLPATPVDKQIVIVSNPTNINMGSNISVSANTGQTIRNSGVTITTFGQFKFVGYIYDLANTQWNNWGYTVT